MNSQTLVVISIDCTGSCKTIAGILLNLNIPSNYRWIYLYSDKHTGNTYMSTLLWNTQKKTKIKIILWCHFMLNNVIKKFQYWLIRWFRLLIVQYTNMNEDYHWINGLIQKNVPSYILHDWLHSSLFSIKKQHTMKVIYYSVVIQYLKGSLYHFYLKNILHVLLLVWKTEDCKGFNYYLPDFKSIATTEESYCSSKSIF